MAPRVLILSWEYPPIVEGGLARHVQKVAEGLVARGDADVHVLTRGALGMVEHETRRGVRVHRVLLPSFSSDLEQFVAWVEGMNRDMLTFGSALGQRFSFDVVHGHDWLVAKAAARLSQRFGIPFATTVHATEHGRHQGWVDKHPQSYIHGIERWMVRRADAVIACSVYMREHIADALELPAHAVTVIPNGIDAGDLHPDPETDLTALRARYARPDERLVLLAGRLVYEKGFQLALDALADVVQRIPGVRFVVAGSGTHEDELRLQADRLGLLSHGTFLGWAPDATLHPLYRVADLCVVPSLFEPFGLVALEAMAAGCACLVADTGGLREVAQEPMRFTPGDHEAMARAMARALSDDAVRAALIAEGERCVSRFDWDRFAGETAAVYESLIGRPAAVRQGA